MPKQITKADNNSHHKVNNNACKKNIKTNNICQVNVVCSVVVIHMSIKCSILLQGHWIFFRILLVLSYYKFNSLFTDSMLNKFKLKKKNHTIF